MSQANHRLNSKSVPVQLLTDTGQMTPYPFKMELRDATPIQVRPVESSDRKLIELGLEHMSEKSRYLRFFRPVSKLSKKTLDDLTWIDGINHIAIGAIDLTHSAPFPIGVARCIRSKSHSSEAEFAIAIIDSFQGRGLGTILVAALAYTAAAQGITTFVATVLSENTSMLNLFTQLGGTSRRDRTGTVYVRVPITKDAEKCLDTRTGATVRDIYQLLREAQNQQGS